MRVALTGFKGVGKTTLGRRLAEALGLPFFDSDAFIEAKCGLSIAQLYEAKGNAHFRQLEHEAIRELSTLERGVVALGGGSLVDPRNLLLISRFRLLCLHDLPEALEARQQNSPLVRERTFAALFREREAHYASLPATHLHFSHETLAERLTLLKHALL